jgi:hypothetical protein
MTTCWIGVGNLEAPLIVGGGTDELEQAETKNVATTPTAVRPSRFT